MGGPGSVLGGKDAAPIGNAPTNALTNGYTTSFARAHAVEPGGSSKARVYRLTTQLDVEFWA